MSHVVTVSNLKGGVGKTSLAVHLASTFGQGCLLLDTDPQQSAVQWADAGEPLPCAVTGYVGGAVHGAILEAAKRFDVVIVDTAPAASVVVKRCLAVSDVVVVPVTASPIDVRAARTMASIVVDIERPDADPLHVLAVRCRVRATTLAGELEGALKAIGLPVAETVIREREVYRHAALDGITVHSIKTSAGHAAKAEICALAGEIQGLWQSGA